MKSKNLIQALYPPAFKQLQGAVLTFTGQHCLNLTQLERPMEESQDSEPDLRNSAVRDYRGASGNVVLVKL